MSSQPKARGFGLGGSGPFWADFARTVWIPQLQVLRETVIERALPAFSDIQGEAEAKSEARWDSLMASATSPELDPADVAELAELAGVDHYLTRRAARQSLVNLFSVALHHLLEQQLLTLLRKELLDKGDENNFSQLKREVVVQALATSGVDIESYDSWACIEELRYLANVVKHAAGGSAEMLAARRPDLFTHPLLREANHFEDTPAPERVLSPLSGEEVFVSDEDLEGYFKCVLQFWNELASDLDSPPQPEHA